MVLLLILGDNFVIPTMIILTLKSMLRKPADEKEADSKTKEANTCE